jgi:acyl-CoA thioester hydrolase
MPVAPKSTPSGPMCQMMVTVRWAECDPAGILYHPHVFDWFSEGRVAWLAARGLPYYEAVRPRGIELLVLSCRAQFHRAVHPGDQLTVGVWAEGLTPTRVTFQYRVLRDGVVVASGTTEHTFVHAGRPVNLRKAAPDLYASLADGMDAPEEA